MSLHDTLRKSIKTLQSHSIPSALLDAELLLMAAINKPKEFIYTHSETKLTAIQLAKFDQLLARRLQREPIAYIVNNKEFYGRDFYVDQRVLIPRPETETIVDQVLSAVDANQPTVIIDVGTGSGCIIISIVKEMVAPFPLFIAIDISADALAVAKKNAKTHGVDKLIKFYQGDLLEPILATDTSNPIFFCGTPRLIGGSNRSSCENSITRIRSIFITANLPYITPEKYQTLQPEITKYEPATALLTPDNDSNYYYKKLDAQIKKLQELTGAEIYKFYERNFEILISKSERNSKLKI